MSCGSTVQGKQGSKYVLKDGAGQAELTKCEGVRSRLFEQIDRALCILVGKVGAARTGQVCLDKVGKQGQVMPFSPRQVQ